MLKNSRPIAWAMTQVEKISLVSRLMRNHFPVGGPTRSSFLVTDPGKITETFERFLQELCLLKSFRKTSRFLEQCANESFPRLERAECKLLGQRLMAACEHIYVKRKSMTSGKKLNPAVYRIIQALNAADVPTEVAFTTCSSSSSLASSSAKASPSNQCASSSAKAVLPVERPETTQSVSEFYKHILGDSPLDGEGTESEENMLDEVVSIASSEQAIEKSATGTTFSQFESTSDMALIRLHTDGTRQVAHMRTGATGFAVAAFDGSDNEHATEIPNSTLLSHQKRSSKNFKRPAAASKKAASKKAASKKAESKKAAAKRPASVVAETPGKSQKKGGIHLQAATDQYVVMVYSKDNSWAIRERGGSQLFAVPKKNRTDEEMLAHIKEVVQRLTDGESPGFVKDWARSWHRKCREKRFDQSLLPACLAFILWPFAKFSYSLRAWTISIILLVLKPLFLRKYNFENSVQTQSLKKHKICVFLKRYLLSVVISCYQLLSWFVISCYQLLSVVIIVCYQLLSCKYHGFFELLSKSTWVVISCYQLLSFLVISCYQLLSVVIIICFSPELFHWTIYQSRIQGPGFRVQGFQPGFPASSQELRVWRLDGWMDGWVDVNGWMGGCEWKDEMHGWMQLW